MVGLALVVPSHEVAAGSGCCGVPVSDVVVLNLRCDGEVLTLGCDGVVRTLGYGEVVLTLRRGGVRWWYYPSRIERPRISRKLMTFSDRPSATYSPVPTPPPLKACEPSEADVTSLVTS